MSTLYDKLKPYMRYPTDNHVLFHFLFYVILKMQGCIIQINISISEKIRTGKNKLIYKH